MHVPYFSFRYPLSLVLLFCGILVVLFGCSSAAPTATPSETPSSAALAETNTLTLWHTIDEEHQKALEQLADEFHKTYPDLTINPVYVGGHDDLSKQMTAAIALGTSPDLVLADRRQIAEFAAQGGLRALEPFMADAELGLSKQDRDDFWQGTLALGTYPTLGNRTYGFPFDQEPLVLFYNADLLKAVNVNGAPRTWEQFGQDATAATTDQTYGWAMRADAATLEGMLASRGSALLTDAETRALLNERAGLASIKLVADLTDAQAAKLASSDDKARNEFGAGKAAFYIGWLSEADALENAQKAAKQKFQIGVAPLPQLDPETPWLLTRGDLFGITKVSNERARNAWFFIRWITSPTQSARWVRATDALPLRASTLTYLSPSTQTNARYRQILNALDNIAPRLVPQPAHPYMDTVERTVGDVWLQATEPKPDVRAILDAIAARINQILAIQP